MSYLLALLNLLYFQGRPFDRSLLCCHERHDYPFLLAHPAKQPGKICLISIITAASQCKETKHVCMLPMVLLVQDS